MPTKSSILSFKFLNKKKKIWLSDFLTEYRRVLQAFVDYFWENYDKIKHYKYADSQHYKDVQKITNTYFMSAMLKDCANQGFGIVNGTWKKYKQREWRYNKEVENGKSVEELEYLHKLLILPTKPIIDENVKANCSNVVQILSETTMSTFDFIISLRGTEKRKKTILPVKATSHLRKLLERGTLNRSAMLSEEDVQVSVSIPPLPNDEDGILGIDIGITNVVTASDGQFYSSDADGNSLAKILKKMSNVKGETKAFQRYSTHRKNIINYCINQLDLDGIREVKLEKIKDMRRYKRVSRFQGRWIYPYILQRLKEKCQLLGIKVKFVRCAYSSQQCSKCDFVDKQNRRESRFCCKSCGYEADADLNAAVNLSKR